MKNKGLIIAAAIILLLGAGYFLMNKKGATQTPGTGTQSETSSGLKSLKDLLSAGVAQKCSYSMTDENGQNEGTTYVSGGKMRVDFSIIAEKKTTKTHMISDGKTSWIWTEGEPNGFKMMVEETEPSPVAGTTQDTSFQAGTDWDEKVDYKCSAWVTDGSFFTPPTAVKFTDFSELFKVNQ